MVTCRDVYKCHVSVAAEEVEAGLLSCFFLLEKLFRKRCCSLGLAELPLSFVSAFLHLLRWSDWVWPLVSSHPSLLLEMVRHTHSCFREVFIQGTKSSWGPEAYIREPQKHHTSRCAEENFSCVSQQRLERSLLWRKVGKVSWAWNR